MVNAPATRAQMAGRSWPSAIPPPGALTATEVRGRAIWLNPSITCSRHLGGLRRRRTQSATEVQGNSLKLPQANRRSPSAARQRQRSRRRRASGRGSRPRRRNMISAASSVVWPLAGAAAVRHRGGIYRAAPARMLVIEACPARSVTSRAAPAAVPWPRPVLGRPGVRQRTLTRVGRTCWLPLRG
jgi:hypothetical protein